MVFIDGLDELAYTNTHHNWNDALVAKGPRMDKSIVLAADPSRPAALPSPVLGSHPSRMLPPVLDGALPAGRLDRDHRPTCPFAAPKRGDVGATWSVRVNIDDHDLPFLLYEVGVTQGGEVVLPPTRVDRITGP